MKKTVFIGLAIGLLATAGTAGAQTDPLQVRSWAAACANCHGTNGSAQPGNEPLAGASKDEEEKFLRTAMSRPGDKSSSFVTGADVSRFQRGSMPPMNENRASAVSPMPGNGAPAAAYVPMGPMVRITRGKTTEAVPVGKK